jgi:hypothetical protein
VADIITVRAVVEKGQTRVRVEGANPRARYVQCPRQWRESLVRGAEFAIAAKLRADGECYVMQPLWGHRQSQSTPTFS